MKKILFVIFFILNFTGFAEAQSQRNPCWYKSGSTTSCIPTGTDNPLPVSATVNASVGGFHWEASLTPVAASTTPTTTTITAGKTIVIQNIGSTNSAYCALGGTTSANATAIPPNSSVSLTSTSETSLTCVTSTSTTTLNLQSGTGLWSNFGGGSGGSGGGGNVNLTQWGSTVLAAATAWGIAPVGGSIVGNVNAYIAGGLNPNGPTTSVNSAPVVLATDYVAPVKGIDALGNTITATNPILIGCNPTAAAPTTVTAGQPTWLYCDTRSNLRVSLQFTNQPIIGVVNNADGIAPQTNTTLLAVQNYPMVFNGTNYDRWQGTNGAANVQGRGTAGTAAGGVMTIQGVASMTPVAVTQSGTWNINSITTLPAITGTVNPTTAANWGIGATAAAVPANASYTGVNIGGNLVGQTGIATGATVKAATVAIVDASGNQITSFGGSGGTASNFGSAFPTVGTAIGFTDGTNMVAGRVGAVANLASATNLVDSLGICQYLASAPTITTGQFNQVQCDINGNQKVTVVNSNSNGQATMANSSPVVIASDQSAVKVSPQAITTGGSSTTGNIVANNTTAVVVKASAGTLYGAQVYGIGSAPAYLKIYNATSATCGSGTPVKRLMIPAAATAANGAGSNITFGPAGINFGTGITYCVTTGIGDADTTAPAANTFLVNLDWQ